MSQESSYAKFNSSISQSIRGGAQSATFTDRIHHQIARQDYSRSQLAFKEEKFLLNKKDVSYLKPKEFHIME